MKNKFIFSVFLLTVCLGFAQGNDPKAQLDIMKASVAVPHPKIVQDSVYNQEDVEVKATYPGGMSQFYKFAAKNMNVGAIDEFVGKVIISFIIDIDGSLTDIISVESRNDQASDAAIAMIKKSPKWIPAQSNGRAVRSTYSLPISITVKP